jgi:hypothetical protein
MTYLRREELLAEAYALYPDLDNEKKKEQAYFWLERLMQALHHKNIVWEKRTPDREGKLDSDVEPIMNYSRSTGEKTVILEY